MMFLSLNPMVHRVSPQAGTPTHSLEMVGRRKQRLAGTSYGRQGLEREHRAFVGTGEMT